MEQYIRIGTIINTHGLKGEVKTFPLTDDVRRFSDLKDVYLDEAHGRRALSVVRARYFKNLVILLFEGIERIEEAQELKGCDLYVARKDAVALKEGEDYVADLIDMQVVDEDGTDLGILCEVIPTGANDVYVVRKDGHRDLLIPAIRSCILSTDIEAGRMTVHLLPGLTDL